MQPPGATLVPTDGTPSFPDGINAKGICLDSGDGGCGRAGASGGLLAESFPPGSRVNFAPRKKKHSDFLLLQWINGRINGVGSFIGPLANR
jgi:hypothetical protein